MSNEPNTLQEFRLREDIKEKLAANSNGMYEKYVDECNSVELRKALKKEQGSICCYCMSSIESSKTKIEHFKSRDENATLEVDYTNLYLSCDGEKINCNENQDNEIVHGDCKCKYRKDEYSKKIIKHCDTCKGNRELKYINFNSIEREIQYKSDGTIFSDNANIDAELNYLLNLNAKILKTNRLNAKNDFYKQLPQDMSWNKSMITRQIEKYEGQSKKAPYLGVILYFLKKKLP